MHLAFLRGAAWTPEIRFPENDSTIQLIHLLGKLWRDRPDTRAHLIQVAVTLTHLVERNNFTPQLFTTMITEDDAETEIPQTKEKHQRLDATLDKLRARYGRDAVYLGSVQDVRESAPMRISFTHIPNPSLEKDD